MSTPIVRRYSDGLLIQFDYPLGPRVTVPLEWDEAEGLMIQLRHELQDHDIEDGVESPDAPAVPRKWVDKEGNHIPPGPGRCGAAQRGGCACTGACYGKAGPPVYGEGLQS